MKRLLAILLCAIALIGHAQEERVLGASFGYGFLWPHRSSMHHLVTGHTKSLELIWERQTAGYSAWEQFYDKPTWGVVGFFGDLGNREQLGHAITIYPYIKLPLAQNDRTRFYLRIGTGFGIGTRSFDADENHKNIALGSNFNGTMGLQLGVERKINHLRIGTSIGLTHFSNAAYQMPNLGYNIPTLNLTVTHSRMSKVYHDWDVEQFDVNEVGKWNYFVTAGYGLREVYPPEGGKFSVFSLSGLVHRNISRKVAIEAGLDLFYNEAVGYWLDEQGKLDSKGDIPQAGLHLGFEQHFGKFGLSLQMGGYVLAKYRDDGNFYHRINFRYHMTDKWLIHWGIKTHLARADHFEIGFGYTIQ